MVKHKCVFIPIISYNQIELEKKVEISNPDYIIDSAEIEIKPFKKKVGKSNDYYLNLFNNDKSGLVLFSSGSTGFPKAMVHDLTYCLYLNVKPKNLTFLVFLMFDHIGGLNAAKYYINGFNDGYSEARNNRSYYPKYKVNILPASPTFLNLMNIASVFDKYDLSSLKLITYGTEPMPKSLLDILKTKTPKTRLIQTFGTSETGIMKTKSKSSSSLLIKFDDDNQEVKIIDGELWIKSKTRVLGYINHNNDSFTDDGWFRTGDLVEDKGDGYYKIVGRKSKVINVGGEKVLPIEVESIILELSFVQDCTVFAKDNPITGQVVAASVVLSVDDKDVKQLKKDIKIHCRRNLERFKVPTQIIIKDKIDHSIRFKKN